MKTQKRDTAVHVVILGHVCIDHITRDGHSTTAPGSPAYFIARTLTNAHVTVIAPHGHDFDALPHHLQFATPTRGEHTLSFDNTIHAHERTQSVHELESATPQPLTRPERRALANADIVILTPLVDRLPADYVTTALNAARPDTLVALLPQGYLRQVGPDGAVTQTLSTQLLAVAAECALIVFSDEDSPDPEVLAWWLTELPHRPRVIVTCADQPALGIEDLETITVPTRPIPPERIQSPVGAGDVFAAHCALAMHAGESFDEVIRAGHVAAAQHLIHG